MRKAVYAVAALVVLLAAAAFLLPRLLDRPRIAAEIQAKLSHAVQGEVRWQDFRVRLLPSPHGELRGLHVETAAATLTADEVTVALRLWPLFFGRAEIASLELARPQLSFTLVPEASVPEEAQLAPAQGALATYRTVLSALVQALQEFAPDTVVAIEDAGVKASVEGLPPIEVSKLGLRARTSSDGVVLDASASSPYWTAMKLAGRIAYADLTSTAELHLARVQGKAWLDWALEPAGIDVELPEVDLDIVFRGDPARSLDFDLAGNAKMLAVTRGGRRMSAAPVVLKAGVAADASQVHLKVERIALGATSLSAGTLSYGPKDGSVAGDVGFQVDLAQALGYARELAPQPLERVTSASGALRGRVKPAVTKDDWRVAVSVEQSDAAVELKDIPGPIRLTRALVDADAHAVQARGVALSLPAGELRLSSARYGLKDGAAAGNGEFDLDVAQTLRLVRGFADLSVVEAASGRLRGSASGEYTGKKWSAGVRVANSDAEAKLKQLPAPVRLSAGVVDVEPRALRADGVALSLAAGNVLVSKARYGLQDGTAAAAAEFDLDLKETLSLVRAALPQVDLGVVESASGRVKGQASGELAGKTWSALLDIAKSDAQAKLKPLPAPVSVSRATVRATPKAITVERADARLMDAAVSASATIAGSDIRGSVTQATIGPKLLAWIWQAAAIPPAFELKAPVRLELAHFAWGQGLEVRGDARFDAGAAVALDLTWSPQALDVRRASVKDARSDVTVTVRTKGSVVEGSYAGTLDSRTIGALLKSAAAPAGAVSGNLRFTYDRDDPRAIQGEGKLQGADIDLTWLAGKPARLERLELSADAAGLHVAEATLDWAGQRATLRGETRSTPEGPLLDATIDSPGLAVDALLPAKSAAPPPPKAGKPASPFPLPVTGRIALRSKFVQYQTYRVEPLAAILHLERDRLKLEVMEALVCGLALPLTLEATPAGYAAVARIAAQQQKLEETVKCLSQESLLITGPMDLRVDVRTKGQPDELVANLSGTVSADVRNGTVTKFALLGNILSMQNVVALAKDGGPKLGAESFPFRQLSAKGHFDKGRFYIDEGVFHSNAIGLGANGWISLTDYQSRLTVLVAPLALVDEAVRKLPLLGYVVGGTFTSLPVGVSGDIRNPTVVPLGPRAITSEMMGLLTRTLTLPGRVVPGKD